MVSRRLYIVGHLVLKGQHPLGVHVASAGDEILLVGVFACQLKADEMTAVVEILAVHAVILCRVPARGLDLADGLPLLRGHQLHADVGIGHPAPAQGVQVGIRLKGVRAGQVTGVKLRRIAVELRPGAFTAELADADAAQVRGRLRRRPRAAGQHQGAHQSQGQQEAGSAFHRTFSSLYLGSWSIIQGKQSAGKGDKWENFFEQ